MNFEQLQTEVPTEVWNMLDNAVVVKFDIYLGPIYKGKDQLTGKTRFVWRSSTTGKLRKVRHRITSTAAAKSTGSGSTHVTFTFRLPTGCTFSIFVRHTLNIKILLRSSEKLPSGCTSIMWESTICTTW